MSAAPAIDTVTTVLTTTIPPQPYVHELLLRSRGEATDAARKGLTYSFEFFPPRTAAADDLLAATLATLAPLSPTFVDVTWGAGGSTSAKTLDVCTMAAAKFGFVVNMHLTCTNMAEGMVCEALATCRSLGIRNLVALRGDPPAGETWRASAEGFGCALDLVKYIREKYGNEFSIAVAGYPEGHPSVILDASGKASEEAMKGEIDYLKAKVDAGADMIITQLFYDVDAFLSFEKLCRAAGISVPILPGMLPIVTYAGLQRIISLCKTYLPPAVAERVEALRNDEAGLKAYGVELCTTMCRVMRDAGTTHFHFYTLNQSASTVAVLQALGAISA